MEANFLCGPPETAQTKQEGSILMLLLTYGPDHKLLTNHLDALKPRAHVIWSKTTSLFCRGDTERGFSHEIYPGSWLQSVNQSLNVKTLQAAVREKTFGFIHCSRHRVWICCYSACHPAMQASSFYLWPLSHLICRSGPFRAVSGANGWLCKLTLPLITCFFSLIL